MTERELESIGKKKLIRLGLGVQVLRSVIPLIAATSVSEVHKKEALYTKIKVVMRSPSNE